MMILIGLIATVWIVVSLLGVALCRTAGVADRQQQKTSFAGFTQPVTYRPTPLYAGARMSFRRLAPGVFRDQAALHLDRYRMPAAAGV